MSNVDEVLEELQVTGETDEERQRQLAAIRFYLRDVVAYCQGAWHTLSRGVSNYKTLLDQIRRWPSACLVTFNYDTMIEAALESLDLRIGSLADYIDHSRPKLIKLHGSVDWVEETEVPGLVRGREMPEPTAQDLIRCAPYHQPLDIFHKIGGDSLLGSVNTRYLLPALAIPTMTKSKFVCPGSHITALSACIPQVTSILVIGWRAAERNFIELLANGLTNPVRVTAVCGTEEASQDSLAKLKSCGIQGSFYPDPGGFTEFIVSRRSEQFLKIQ